MKKYFLLIFVFAYSFANADPATNESFQPPAEKSLDAPVNLSEDQKALIEAKKVVEAINNDDYFKFSNDAKVQALKERVAVSKKNEAIALAEQSKALSEASSLGKKPDENSNKSESKNIKVIQTDNTLLNVSVGLISAGKAILNINGNSTELIVGESYSGIKLVSVSNNLQHVTVKSIKTGEIRELGLRVPQSVSSGFIQPIKNDLTPSKN